MGDMGDYWREHKEYKRELRTFWHECPDCKVAFGTASLVAPGRRCKHHKWLAPGNVGDDKAALKELWRKARGE